MSEYQNVIVVNHPLVAHNLSLIRDGKTSREVFLNAFNRLGSLLVLEGLKSLPLTPVEIKTPVATCRGCKVDESFSIVFAPILRAGLALSDVAVSLFPQAHVWHIGMYRDEQTHLPIWYYDKTPAIVENAHKMKVFILDPMLATGHSALSVVDLFVRKGINIQNITFICTLSAPEGVNLLQKAYPDLRIITGAIDEKLNEKAYIVPGLGDAGDRFFNTL